MRSLLPCLFALAGCTAADEATGPAHPSGITAFVGVDVLTMVDGAAPLLDRAVLVHDGRILDIVDADTPLPDDAVVLDGAGRWLMPGLIDAHVHVWYEHELTLLVANGVTATRNLFGDPVQRRWRNQIVDGARFGPTLVTAGPIVDGNPPLWQGSDVAEDRAGGAAVVASQQDRNYDLAKVYNNLTRSAWSGAIDEGEALGFDVSGHVPWAVGWDDVVASSQKTIEHLDGLIDVVGSSSAPIFLYDEPAMTAAMDQADAGLLQDAAERAAADGVVLVPTLVVMDRFGSQTEHDAWAAEPEMAYVHPDIAFSWSATPPPDPSTLAMLDRYAETLLDFTLALHDSGARVALGTDANNAWVIPGFSAHEELRLLVEAGLQPTEALRAGTAVAAEAIGRPDLGTVEVGQRADLLLLDADPRDDVAHAQQRVGVMLGGVWTPEAELVAMLDAVAAEYAGRRSASAPRFEGCRHHRGP